MTLGAPRRQQLFGDHRRRLSVGGFALTLSRATVPKEELPEHIHDEGQIILALDAGYLSRAFGTGEPGEGLDLLYNPPGTVHRDCFFEAGGRFLSVSVPLRLAPALPGPVRIRTLRSTRTAAALAGLCARPSSGDALKIQAAVLDLLGEAAAAQPPREQPAWLARAHEMIAVEAVDQRATVSGIAAALGIHPVYFARAFRASVGHGPAKAIQLRRVGAATAMLSRDRSLAEIAAECGFADQSHLCRSMRHLFGEPPSTIGAAFR